MFGLLLDSGFVEADFFFSFDGFLSFVGMRSPSSLFLRKRKWRYCALWRPRFLLR